MAHDFLSIYPAKLVEYLLAIGYLLLFIPFWRYVQGGKPPAGGARRGRGRRRRARGRPRAGRARLRPPPAGSTCPPASTSTRATPGRGSSPTASSRSALDDFAHKLVGPARVTLPALGEHVAQGEPALEIGDGGPDGPDALADRRHRRRGERAAREAARTASRTRTAPAGSSR